MFCFQCEQTAKGEGCTKIGVCGKQPEVAALQDLLIYTLKGLSLVAHDAREKGRVDTDLDGFVFEAVFSTLTNVDFDAERFVPMIRETVQRRDALKQKVGAAEYGHAAADFVPAGDMDGLVGQGQQVGINADPGLNPDIRSLRELITYGIKGLAAYADHARILGQTDDQIAGFIYEALAAW
jgi:hydroxylamine reductase